MTDDIRELIEAARECARELVDEDFPCYLGILPMEQCGRCSRILRLRAAIKAVEATL